MNGEWKSFFVNGKLESIEHYNNGQKDGRWLFLDDKGDTLKVEVYKLDSLVRKENR